MNGHPGPDSYNNDDVDDEDTDKAPKLYSRIQTFFVFAVFAIALAELVLAVRDKGLSHHALGTAEGASGDASQVNTSRTTG